MDISIIIPIYNTEHYLKGCLDSVANNIALVDAEVLLIDDGSTDKSSLIAHEYSCKDHRFRYYRRERAGQGAARNYGVSLARGEYLMFVDSDDLLVNDTLPHMLAAARYNNTDFTTCDIARLQNGKVLGSSMHIAAFTPLADNVAHIKESPHLANDCSVCGKLIRKQFYDKARLSFPTGYLFEDYMVVLPMYYQANAVSIVRKCGYLWRVRKRGELSTTQRRTDINNLSDKIKMLQLLLTYCDEHEVEETIRIQFAVRVARHDFIGYIENLHNMPPEKASEFINLIGQIADEAIPAKALAQAPVKFQQLFASIRERNLDHVMRVSAYNNTSYRSARVHRIGNNLELELPNDLFTIDSRDYMLDYDVIIPMGYITEARIDGMRLRLKGCVRMSRVSIADPAEQIVKAYLINDITGTKVPLECSSCWSKETTERSGSMLSLEGHRFHTYNYDGCGFQLVIDYEALDAVDGLEGNNFIVLQYENWVTSGTRTLRGISAAAKKQAKKLAKTGGRYSGTFTCDVRDTPIVGLNAVTG